MSTINHLSMTIVNFTRHAAGESSDRGRYRISQKGGAWDVTGMDISYLDIL